MVTAQVLQDLSLCSCWPLRLHNRVLLQVQVSALSKHSGPAVQRARLPLALSNPLMGQPPKVSDPRTRFPTAQSMVQLWLVVLCHAHAETVTICVEHASGMTDCHRYHIWRWSLPILTNSSMSKLSGSESGTHNVQDDEDKEEDHLEAAVEERDAETFDDSEFYQQLLKEFLEGSAVGSGAGALAASAGVRLPTPQRSYMPRCCQMFRLSWEGVQTMQISVYTTISCDNHPRYSHIPIRVIHILETSQPYLLSLQPVTATTPAKSHLLWGQRR